MIVRLLIRLLIFMRLAAEREKPDGVLRLEHALYMTPFYPGSEKYFPKKLKFSSEIDVHNKENICI